MSKPKARTTITIDEGVLTRVKLAVEQGQAASTSAYIEHAIIGQLAAEADFDATVAEILNGTGGPATDEERAAARRLLSGKTA